MQIHVYIYLSLFTRLFYKFAAKKKQCNSMHLYIDNIYYIHFTIIYIIILYTTAGRLIRWSFNSIKLFSKHYFIYSWVLCVCIYFIQEHI